MTMKHYKAALRLAAVAILAVATGCKGDDDDETTSKYMSGTLAFAVPSYVLPGDVLTPVPGGVTAGGNDIGYYWTVSPVKTTKDTTRYIGDDAAVTGALKFTVPDTLCVLTFACTAFAETGYYTSTSYQYSTIVSPEFGRTLTDDGVTKSLPCVTDARDGKVYYYRTIGDLDWFVRNVSYLGSGISYCDAPALDDIYGRYYSWEEAQSACPEGWRVPSAEDWYSLAKAAGFKGESASSLYEGIAGNLMADAKFNGEKMWEYWPAVKITNSTGFCALPTGYAMSGSTGNDFYGNLEYAVYWTSDEFTPDGDDESQGVFEMMYVETPDVQSGSAHKTGFSAPVRCVRDRG